jgi:L-ascorbate metabolism protein UlaG (beta-lactamase superfamily)
MKKPFLQDDAFLADVAQAREQSDRLHLWWMGQSGFLLMWQGSTVLLDPYLSDSLAEMTAGSDQPHVRLTERVVDPRRLDFVEVVTASHNHPDHLDGATILPLLDANPQLTLIVPAANLEEAAVALDLSPARLTPIATGQPVRVQPFTFHAVPAAHEALEMDDQGRHKYTGLVVKAGPWTIYHSGDTVRYNGLVERLSPWQLDVALLPINGRHPAPNIEGNLTGPEAAQLAHDIGAALAIPCHYDMFEFNTASPDPFVAAAEELGQRYRVLRNGERVSLGGNQ